MYHVDITNTGEHFFKVKTKDYEFYVDINGKGVTPPDTLLAALGTCIGVYVRKYCDGAKLQLPAFDVCVEADLPKEPPVRFSEINVTIDLKGADFDERRINALLDFVKNCPVHNALKTGPELEVNIKIGSIKK